MSTFQYLLILGLTSGIALGQKVAPGVPPQHYMDPNQNLNYQQVPQMQYVQPGQQQVHPQQQLHQQVHPQQIHQQQVHPQQVHQQQLHQQQQQQQVPIQHDPNAIHHQQQMAAAQQQAHRPQQQILDTANIQGEKAHIQEHFDVPMDTSKMSEQELQFHYFKMHDSDHNNKLDGCELIKSLIHWHEKGNKDSHHKEEGAEEHHDKIFSDEELVSLIDPILAMDDTGRDGYIDYPEFIKAQQKAAAQRKTEKP